MLQLQLRPVGASIPLMVAPQGQGRREDRWWDTSWGQPLPEGAQRMFRSFLPARSFFLEGGWRRAEAGRIGNSIQVSVGGSGVKVSVLEDESHSSFQPLGAR